MESKHMWANIITDWYGIPNKVIITNGQAVTEIPVTNTNMKTAKKMCMSVYDVPERNILVSMIRGEK